MRPKRTFTVLIEQDEEGYLVATVPALRGCHTQAKSLDTLMKRVREVIALCLESVINFPGACARSQFFRVQGARSDGYRVSPSDEQRRNRENWPQPEGLRHKSAHTSLSSSTLEPPKPSSSASSEPIFARNAY